MCDLGRKGGLSHTRTPGNDEEIARFEPLTQVVDDEEARWHPAQGWRLTKLLCEAPRRGDPLVPYASDVRQPSKGPTHEPIGLWTRRIGGLAGDVDSQTKQIAAPCPLLNR